MDQIRTYPVSSFDTIQTGYGSRVLDESNSLTLSQEQSRDLCLRLLEKYSALVNSYGINADTDPVLLKN